MNRRAFLSIAIMGTTAVSGCLAQGRAPVGQRGPQRDADQARLRDLAQRLEGVESIEFSIFDQSGPLIPPRIEFELTDRQVRITGRLEAGNPCDETRLKTVEYDGKTDELSVLVEVGKIPFSWGCPDALKIDTYEVVITFDSRLPETVTATHRDFQDETSRTTATSSA